MVKGIEYLTDIIEKCDDALDRLVTLGMSPNNEKQFERRFSVAEAASMVGRTRNTLYRLGEEIGVSPDKNPATNRIIGYKLEQINKMREHFGTSPRRNNDDKCSVIAVQSFKGGVSKSVTTVYLAQYLALKGYRVLIVDCDSQASATSSFGFVPDTTFDIKHTIARFLEGEEEDLNYAIIETYFPGIDLVPSCLPLYETEFDLFNAVSHAESNEERAEYYNEFANAIATVSDRYDVVLMDSPPSLGMISINILVAANAIIVPTPPSLYDFASTAQYFRMVKRVIAGIAPNKEYDFIKVMPSKVERGKARQIDFLNIMRDQFGNSILKSVFALTSAIPNTASLYQTVYDQKKKDTKVLQMLDTLFSELETEIRRSWPSHELALEEEGVI
ncbi:MAG: AAA family ATPase [Pseudomonadales bacterium]|nr:AAA family ATPase [Pseudomonadales bacterium]